MNTAIIIGMALITFVNRYAFFIQWIQFQPNDKVRLFLSFSSYSVLTAIWSPLVFSFDPTNGFIHAGYDYLLATSLAIVLTTLRIPSLLTIAIALSTFFYLRFVFLA